MSKIKNAQFFRVNYIYKGNIQCEHLFKNKKTSQEYKHVEDFGPQVVKINLSYDEYWGDH